MLLAAGGLPNTACQVILTAHGRTIPRREDANGRNHSGRRRARPRRAGGAQARPSRQRGCAARRRSCPRPSAGAMRARPLRPDRVDRCARAGMNTLLLGIGFGLVTASVLAISTVALSLQFGVTRVPNFAHGELMTVGAYAALVTERAVHNTLLAALAAIAAGCVLGVAIMAAIHVLLKYTYFGRAQRAVAENLSLAQASGINSAQVINRTWVLTGAMAGLAGFVLGITTGGLYPAMGFRFLLIVFAAAILGGIGQPYGAMAGSLVVGITMEVSALYISSNYKTVVAFILLILALLLRPQGLVTTRRPAAA